MGILPLGLRNRPEQHELGHDLFQAFNVLSSSRGCGMSGPLAITLTEMNSYCQMFGIVDLDEREHFVATMQRLDATYIAKRTPSADKETKSEVVAPGDGTDNRPKG